MLFEWNHNYIEHVANFMALATTFIGLSPQIIKNMQEKSAKQLSWIMLINYSICSLSWITHALLAKDNVVLAGNAASLVISVILILQKICYDRNSG